MEFDRQISIRKMPRQETDQKDSSLTRGTVENLWSPQAAALKSASPAVRVDVVIGSEHGGGRAWWGLVAHRWSTRPTRKCLCVPDKAVVGRRSESRRMRYQSPRT